MTFLRYIIIQVFAYALDMGAFIFLAFIFKDKLVLMNIAGKVIAGIFAFFLHRHFTFESTQGSKKTQALRYFSLLAINIPFSSAIFTIGLHFLNHPTLVKFISDILCVMLTYWISKLFVFHLGAADRSSPNRTGES
ncbi:GtrA family protein [Pseudomonas sp. MWU13-2105]|uniref:GtrA family protein n=1 Tax=Pseudomonas sp. MWU13-2105 TaxID=2935074 RepID=UPI00200C0A89|nr:GtrA family protein [Pseudomonas sp. MWU13-2105]